MKPSRLFIHGLAKSGTSFLRNILHAHPDIVLAMERLNVLWREFKLSSSCGDLELFGDIYKNFVDRQTRSCPGRRYIGDKICFGHSPYIDVWESLYLESSKIIVICRDPRDRLISMRYHFCNRDDSTKSEDWFYPCPYCDPAELRWWNDWMPKVQKNHAWIVYYEELFNRPHETTRKILDYLEIQASPELIQNMVAHARSPRKISYEMNPFRKGSPGEWKKKLLPDDGLTFGRQMGSVLFDHGWENKEGWEYTSLETLRYQYYLRRLFLKFPVLQSREFWQWLKDHRDKEPWIEKWFQKTQDYHDPLMERKYYALRSWPVPKWIQRSAAAFLDKTGPVIS